MYELRQKFSELFRRGQMVASPGTGEEVLFLWVGMGSTNYAMRFFDPDGAELTLSDAQRQHYLSLVRTGQHLW